MLANAGTHAEPCTTYCDITLDFQREDRITPPNDVLLYGIMASDRIMPCSLLAQDSPGLFVHQAGQRILWVGDTYTSRRRHQANPGVYTCQLEFHRELLGRARCPHGNLTLRSVPVVPLRIYAPNAYFETEKARGSGSGKYGRRVDVEASSG